MLSLDQEKNIPFGCLVPCPFNPKPTISGVYRAGLASSLGVFGLRDRLKVWPVPGGKNAYMVLNGNQRLDVLRETEMRRLFIEKCGVENIQDMKQLEVDGLMESPDFGGVVRECRKALHSLPIPCQVITRLDADSPFTEDDAKLFVASWDRNRATYDEVGLSALAEALRESRGDKLVSRLLRPERVIAPPPPRSEALDAATAPAPAAKPDAPPPGEPDEDEDEHSHLDVDNPWGPPPPVEGVPARESAPEALVPLTFSVTRDGYHHITSTILKINARLYRERKLREALDRLLSLLPEGAGRPDDVVVETALMILEANISVESDAEE